MLVVREQVTVAVALEHEAMQFLIPPIRVELIRTMLTRAWDDETWPAVREEFKKALALRAGCGGRGGGINP